MVLLVYLLVLIYSVSNVLGLPGIFIFVIHCTRRRLNERRRRPEHLGSNSFLFHRTVYVLYLYSSLNIHTNLYLVVVALFLELEPSKCWANAGGQGCWDF